MRVRNQTTVVLAKKAQEIKEDLAPVFGLKNILSAGLVLLGKLSAKEQKQAIAEANDRNAEPLVVSSEKVIDRKLAAQENRLRAEFRQIIQRARKEGRRLQKSAKSSKSA